MAQKPPDLNAFAISGAGLESKFHVLQRGAVEIGVTQVAFSGIWSMRCVGWIRQLTGRLCCRKPPAPRRSIDLIESVVAQPIKNPQVYAGAWPAERVMVLRWPQELGAGCAAGSSRGEETEDGAPF